MGRNERLLASARRLGGLSHRGLLLNLVRKRGLVACFGFLQGSWGCTVSVERSVL